MSFSTSFNFENDIVVKTEQLAEEERTFIESSKDVETTLSNLSVEEDFNPIQYNVVVKTELLVLKLLIQVYNATCHTWRGSMVTVGIKWLWCFNLP